MGEKKALKAFGFVALVLLISGIISWALFESFRADQSMFDDFDESYYGEDLDEPLLETAEPPAVTPVEPAKPAAKAKPAAPPPAKEPAAP